MATMHKWWSEAKKKVQTKDWEKKINFRDALGPSLDTFEKRYVKINETINAAAKLITEQEALAKLIVQTIRSYETKINEASKQFTLTSTDSNALLKALQDIMGLANRTMGANKNYLDSTSRYATIVKQILT